MRGKKGIEFKTIFSVVSFYKRLLSEGIIKEGGAAYARYIYLKNKYKIGRKY